MSIKEKEIKRESRNVGIFHVDCDTLVVSDPCYPLGTWCTGELDNVAQGKWLGGILKVVDGDAFSVGRVSALTIAHESLKGEELETAVATSDPEDFEVGVDSGQAGFFAKDKYKKDYTTPHPKRGWFEYDRSGYQNLLSEYQRMKQKVTDNVGTIRGSEFYTDLDIAISKLKRKLDPNELDTTTDWYDICCDHTLSDLKAGVVDGGVVSSSGHGDGGYTCYTYRDTTGKLTYAEIVFITG